MKVVKTAIFLCFVLGISACSCQGQPTQPPTQANSTDSARTTIQPPPIVLRNLIQDTVAISSLTDDDRRVLSLRYDNHPAVTSYTVIWDPFPRADSLGAFRKLRCNMSANRVFTAERTSLRIDYTLNRPDLIWEGKLVGTGETLDRPDWNWIKITTRRDTNIVGGYEFAGAALRVNSAEAYYIEKFPPSYFVLVRYAPQRNGIMSDRIGTSLPINR